MGIISSLKIHPTSGFPFVNCKGVITTIELSISFDDCLGVASVVGSLDVIVGVLHTFCEGIST
jgi:hypothetical protein